MDVSKQGHILVIRFSAMGDVAMTVPVVQAFASQHPDVQVTVLSQPFARDIFEALSPNIKVCGANIRKEYAGVKGLNKLFKRLVEEERITAVADLHNVLRSKYLCIRFSMIGIPVIHLDKHRQERRQLTAKHNKYLKPLPSVYSSYAKVFRDLGYTLEEKFQTRRTYFQSYFKSMPAADWRNRDAGEWIGIAPFAAHKGKTYPLPLVEEVIGGLALRHPAARIFLFGGGGQEHASLSVIASRQKQCMAVSDICRSLKEELALMSSLNVMLSMDSANMHFASLVGTPVISIWGATHPYAGFGDWNQSPGNAVQIDLPCRPCSIFGNKPCYRGDYACLYGIKPKDVIMKLERYLKGSPIKYDMKQVNKPLVTVITVTYNAERLLRNTLESVKEQQYIPLEVIVVDGGSSDNTLKIVYDYNSIINKMVSEPDKGIYDAMNKGVRMASGDWIIFLNAGDTFASNSILDKIFTLQQDGYGIIYGDVIKNGKIKKAPPSIHLYHRMLFCHQSSLTRRILLLECPFDINYRFSADFKFFMIQCLKRTRFRYINMPVSNFDTTGISHSKRSKGLLDNMKIVREIMPRSVKTICTARLMLPYLICRIKGE